MINLVSAVKLSSDSSYRFRTPKRAEAHTDPFNRTCSDKTSLAASYMIHVTITSQESDSKARFFAA